MPPQMNKVAKAASVLGTRFRPAVATEVAGVDGEQAEAATWWTRLAEHEPLSSRVIIRLMSALAAHGDRAGALARARRYEEELGRELQAELWKLGREACALRAPYAYVVGRRPSFALALVTLDRREVP